MTNGLHRYVSLEDRIMARVDFSTDCWLWTGTTNGTGYAKVYANGRLRVVHELIWELANGPKPAGMDLDHLCEVKHCINPDHLEPVTRQENLRRASKGNFRKTHCPKGHEYTTDNILPNKRGKRNCKTCHRLREQQRRSTQSG
jgi:hypothetical protein